VELLRFGDEPGRDQADQGRRASETFIEAAVRFIERWKTLRASYRP